MIPQHMYSFGNLEQMPEMVACKDYLQVEVANVKACGIIIHMPYKWLLYNNIWLLFELNYSNCII